MTTISRSNRADLVSAWGIGVGIGLIALQVTWLVGARVASLFWDAPVGPTVAFVLACTVGTVVAIVAGRRLARSTGTNRDVA